MGKAKSAISPEEEKVLSSAIESFIGVLDKGLTRKSLLAFLDKYSDRRPEFQEELRVHIILAIDPLGKASKSNEFIKASAKLRRHLRKKSRQAMRDHDK